MERIVEIAVIVTERAMSALNRLKCVCVVVVVVVLELLG